MTLFSAQVLLSLLVTSSYITENVILWVRRAKGHYYRALRKLLHSPGILEKGRRYPGDQAEEPMAI